MEPMLPGRTRVRMDRQSVSRWPGERQKVVTGFQKRKFGGQTEMGVRASSGLGHKLTLLSR